MVLCSAVVDVVGIGSISYPPFRKKSLPQYMVNTQRPGCNLHGLSKNILTMAFSTSSSFLDQETTRHMQVCISSLRSFIDVPVCLCAQSTHSAVAADLVNYAVSAPLSLKV